ncbi:MAG: S41 family peptidase [Clostridia bacterium]|nr:S41 family peptidase [Clostridia bacterium]
MEQDKRQRIYKTIMLMILVAVITFIATTVLIYNKIGDSNKTKYVIVGNQDGKGSMDEISANLTRLKGVIDKYYLNEYDEEDLNEWAIKGYVAGLGDEYSEYITPKEYEDFSQDIYGSFIGIGIYFGKDVNNNMLIVSTIENSAAEKAGLKGGDLIKKVDDYVVTEESETSELSNKIKGQEGTTVKLEVLRGEETLTFEIVRENVKLHYIKSEVLENNIGYIKIVSFDENTASEFKVKLEELLSKNIKGLILDLRNNGGGIVQEATQIADYFLDKDKVIISTRDKNGKENVTKAEENKLTDVSLVLLTNGYTASSSEILASALKENDRAKIIGEKTYGKGVIQNVYRLLNGGALKLTTQEYYTAGGNKINEIGVEPTEEVKLPEDANEYNVEREQDTQLQRAIEILK